MEREYRKVIENIRLTKDEASTLYKASCLLGSAKDDIENSHCQYDYDLLDAISKSVNALETSNARMNVHMILDID